MNTFYMSMCEIASVAGYAVSVWAVVKILELIVVLYQFNVSMKMTKEANKKGRK